MGYRRRHLLFCRQHWLTAQQNLLLAKWRTLHLGQVLSNIFLLDNWLAIGLVVTILKLLMIKKLNLLLFYFPSSIFCDSFRHFNLIAKREKIVLLTSSLSISASTSPNFKISKGIHVENQLLLFSPLKLKLKSLMWILLVSITFLHFATDRNFFNVGTYVVNFSFEDSIYLWRFFKGWC